jgi:alkylation response protein AidB-like acyl-CoA dehydrogenase
MTSCYLKTVQYTKEREQFDQPISNFQVLQHRMVDMFIDSELAKSLLYKAMLEVDSNSDDRFKHVSALKAHVGKFGKLSAQNAVQLHGGMGVSEEMMIGHYLKKMVAVDAMFGNADFHLKAFSK